MKKRALLKLTNEEIRAAIKEHGIMKASKVLGISYDTAFRAKTGARQCPSRRPGNLK